MSKNMSNKIWVLNQTGLNPDMDQYALCPCDKPSYFPARQGDVVGFQGTNPLLMEAARGQRLLLDTPNLASSVKLGDVPVDSIYTPEFRTIGGLYNTYNDIHSGQIQYYIDDATKDTYRRPVYITPAKVFPVMKTTPMSVNWIDYERVPCVGYKWKYSDTVDCDSRTHDTLEFRQSIMTSQQRLRNSQRYEGLY